MLSHSAHGKCGFTLIELAIVLIVLGLLAGGMMVGRDLIRQAQLRQMLGAVNEFNTAVAMFDAKYDCLPGDCRNATSYWPPKTKCMIEGPNGLDFSTSTVCNGNGNGKIAEMAPYITQEIWGFWQQLALAGLIKGNYTGQSALGHNLRYVGPANSPAGPLGGLFAINYWGINSDTHFGNSYFPIEYGHVYMYASGRESGDKYHLSGDYLVHLLTPQELFSIDDKVDDGKPGSGQIMSFRHLGGFGLGANCVTTGLPSTSAYQSGTARTCTPLFVRQF